MLTQVNEFAVKDRPNKKKKKSHTILFLALFKPLLENNFYRKKKM